MAWEMSRKVYVQPTVVQESRCTASGGTRVVLILTMERQESQYLFQVRTKFLRYHKRGATHSQRLHRRHRALFNFTVLLEVLQMSLCHEQLGTRAQR